MQQRAMPHKYQKENLPRASTWEREKAICCNHSSSSPLALRCVSLRGQPHTLQLHIQAGGWGWGVAAVGLFPPLFAAGRRETSASLCGREARGCSGAPCHGKEAGGGTREGGTPPRSPPNSQASSASPGRSPPSGAPPPSSGRTPPHTLHLRPGAAPLRVVLVEVGEEQMAAAGVAALTGQVHGGMTLATPVRRGLGEGGRVNASSRQNTSTPATPAPTADPRPPHPRRPLVYAAGGGAAPRLRRPAPAARQPASPPGHRTATAHAPAPRRGGGGSGREEPRMRSGGGAELGRGKGWGGSGTF